MERGARRYGTEGKPKWLTVVGISSYGKPRVRGTVAGSPPAAPIYAETAPLA